MAHYFLDDHFFIQLVEEVIILHPVVYEVIGSVEIALLSFAVGMLANF